ncbi:MAG: squalene--hopene cyclase [Dehalococcoidia bacterium]|nr:squalene--hopene cyclase [Dehalococcoidia bacterium]
MVRLKGQAEKSSLKTAVDIAVQRSREYLLACQHTEGYWWGRLESNSTMEAEYLMLQHFMEVPDRSKWPKLVKYILTQQRQDGSWGQYYGAPGDVSTAVECYFALKLAGVSPETLAMQRAKQFILSRGGVPKTRVFTKIWLALLGQWPWEGVPAMLPEFTIVPARFPLNIYSMSSWARGTVVPILILVAKRPVRPVPESAFINELFPDGADKRQHHIRRPKPLVSLPGLFWGVDKGLRLYEKIPIKPGRGYAFRKAERWIVEHQEADGSWGGIQPPWVYSLMALKTLGRSLDDPVIAKGLKGFDGFAIEDEETFSVQACVSPVWDTCLAMIALEDAGVPPDHPALQRAAAWLLAREIRKRGDWSVRVPKAEPSGWPFEFSNDWYPDIDDTAEVLIALHRSKLAPPDEERKQAAIDRATAWLLHMQSRDGGWAAFDKNNLTDAVAKLPFSDFGEMLDPPSADVTAHVLEALGRLGYGADHGAARRGLAYLWKEQEPEGPWFGRWGVNYIYGSGAAVPALEVLDQDVSDPRVQKTVAWLVQHQNQDGGWGESCTSYVDASWRGRGPSTASQTAWALLALMAAGQWGHAAVERGLLYLAGTQKSGGSWDEPWFTGTGFPGYGIGRPHRKQPKPGENGYQGAEMAAGFMINYNMYRNYWPLMALGRYKRHQEGVIRRSTDG